MRMSYNTRRLAQALRQKLVAETELAEARCLLADTQKKIGLLESDYKSAVDTVAECMGLAGIEVTLPDAGKLSAVLTELAVAAGNES